MDNPTPVEPTPAQHPDPDPEFVLQAAYLHAFARLRRRISMLAFALLVASGVGGYATWTAITTGEHLAAEKITAHDDTQSQIAQLACGVVDQIPPDHGLADAVRARYKCGPYKPPKAVVQPRKPTA